MALEIIVNSVRLDDDLWRWQASLGPEELVDDVSEVVYTLDPTLPRPVRRMKNAGEQFRVQDITAASFTIYARALLKDGSSISLERLIPLEGFVAREEQKSLGKPVLLAVDDDASVLKSVVQDLRRKYGGDYQILRAQSGPDAIGVLNACREKGERVALILADLRMPVMNGLELLLCAREIHPRAKCALLTAFADTKAALTAINSVKLDKYITKPWDPPETELYPFVDEMLADWWPVRSR